MLRSNLLAFAGGGTPVNKEEFRHEVQVVRTRLRNISRRTIDPRSRFVKVWDLLMVLALLMTTFITPFEVAFFEATAVYNGPINFTINRLGARARGTTHAALAGARTQL